MSLPNTVPITLEHFIQRVFPSIQGGIELRAIAPDKGIKERIFTRSMDDINSFVARNRSQNIYFAPCTRRPGSATGKKEDVYEMVGLWADMDFKDYGQEPGRAIDLAKGEKVARKVLSEFPIKPSIILKTGGGLQLLWLFHGPERIDVEKIESRLRGICHQLKSDKAVAQSAAVLRLPFTTNFPNEKKLKDGGRTGSLPAFVESINDNRYYLSDFNDFQEAKEMPKKVKAQKIDIIPYDGALAEKLKACFGRDPLLTKTWNRDRSELDDQSGSGYDMALASRLAKLKFTPEEVMAVLKVYHGGKGKGKGEAPEAYYELTVSKVFDEENKSEKGTISSKLINQCVDLECFVDSYGREFVSFETQGAMQTWSMNSQNFKKYLRTTYYNSTGKGLSDNSLKEVVETLKAKATAQNIKKPVYLRVSELCEGHFYIDAGNENWNAYEVDASGCKLIKSPPCKFQRSTIPAQLSEPKDGYNKLSFKNTFFLDDRSCALIMGWLLGVFNPRGPYPLLALVGEQGSAKSTLARFLKSIVDNGKPLVRSFPKSEKDLLIAAQKNWVLSFDNVSHINEEMSDVLCRLSTGGGFGTRTLYTDGDEFVIDVKRPVIINGIGDLITRPDLLDRAIVVKVPSIPEDKRLPESKIDEVLDQLRGQVLWALLNAASRSIANQSNVEIKDCPRMADFCHWVVAGEELLGLNRGEFLNHYKDMQLNSKSLLLDSDPVAEAIMQLLEQGSIEKTISGLWNELRFYNTGSSYDWPKSSRGLRSKLDRLAPGLRAVGINIKFGERMAGDGKRLIYIWKDK